MSQRSAGMDMVKSLARGWAGQDSRSEPLDNSTPIDAHNPNRYHVRYDIGSSYNNVVTYCTFKDAVNIR